MKYNKMVRDLIPDEINQSGKKCSFRIADDSERLHYLHDKLLEECNELIESDSLEEIADVLEVIEAIEKELGYKQNDVLSAKESKRSRKGSFSKGVILLSVEDK